MWEWVVLSVCLSVLSALLMSMHLTVCLNLCLSTCVYAHLKICLFAYFLFDLSVPLPLISVPLPPSSLSLLPSLSLPLFTALKTKPKPEPKQQNGTPCWHTRGRRAKSSVVIITRSEGTDAAFVIHMTDRWFGRDMHPLTNCKRHDVNTRNQNNFYT